ncbi:MAG TPA: helix-turn-helix domain-containing protein [Pseudonocardia sp.]|nr:helix-turn-helix domain-containing protein [Pseudonocardia sp.]
MTFVHLTHLPHPHLRGALRRVSGFAEHTGQPQLRTELPIPSVTLILGLGDPIRVSSSTGSGEFTSFLAGLHEIPVDTEHFGSFGCVQVDLSPLGAYRLLGRPMSELTDTVLGLDDLGLTDLAGRLIDIPGWPERFALLERTLGSRIADGPEVDHEVSWAWRELVRSGGTTPVNTLAAGSGWSRRHFTARFRRQVGLPPKALAQVVRFRRALELLATTPTIAPVAAEAGYADHSHLVREFRRLTGSPPSRLLTTPGEVAFVQDRAPAGS